MGTTRIESGRSCRRCKAHLPSAAQRCMQCGTQVRVPEAIEPLDAARQERDRVRRQYNLTAMQLEILSSAAGKGQQIFVCGSDALAEGEVKSGDRRFYGNEAVVAIAALAAPGLIVPNGDDCFSVTSAGLRLIKVLNPTAVSTD